MADSRKRDDKNRKQQKNKQWRIRPRRKPGYARDQHDQSPRHINNARMPNISNQSKAAYEVHSYSCADPDFERSQYAASPMPLLEAAVLPSRPYSSPAITAISESGPPMPMIAPKATGQMQ
ncbi:MAG: hypothetical protein Q4A11_03965 [Brachymonas sp.]|nr:hypothetical protein [Brachymonas sp.]